MSQGIKAGRSNFLFYNNRAENPPGTGTGTYAAPDWVVINRIGDLDRSNTKASTEVDMRASPTTVVVFSNKSREISFTYYKREGVNDLVFNVLQDSYENDTMVELAIAEGDISGATPPGGIYYDRGPFVVGEMTKAEPVAGVDAYDITMSVVDAETIPGSGTPFPYEPGLVTEEPPP